MRIEPVRPRYVQPGSLVVSDFFDGHGGPTHGDIVEQSARDLGFTGTIERHQAERTHEMVLADRFFSRLDNRNFTPDEMRAFVYDYALNRQVGELKSASLELQSLGEARNSVLNLSRGWGQAQVVEAIYSRLRLAWDVSAYPQDKIVARRRLAKIAPALGLDAERVQQRGPERNRLQQALIDLVAGSACDHRLTEAQQAYDQLVHAFESGHNSVVVAAANSGEILPMMHEDGGQPNLPPGFFNNRLANPETTTVGATRCYGGSERVAGYTNPDPGIDVYADGDIGQAWGTSFATPRTGGLMAELHGRNPDKTSAEIEGLVAHDFAENLPDYDGYPNAPALNEEQTREWFKAT
ncbi:MAG: S8 family serine peptidase [Vulcanimicrobiota bacterium]